MKRIINILTAMMVIVLTASCMKDDPTPTANFQDKLISVHPTQTVELTVNLDKEAPADITVPVKFTCESQAFEPSASVFSFKQGEKTAKITLTDLGLPAGATVTAQLIASKEAYVGLGDKCFITRDAEEVYSISVSRSKIDLYSGTKANIDVMLAGEYSGTKFQAHEDISIPFTLSGNGAEFISVQGGRNEVVIKKGGNKGTVVLNAAADLEDDCSAYLKIDNGSAAEYDTEIRLVSGECLNPSALVGTWLFDRIFDVDDYVEFAEGDGYDPDRFPFANEGFTLTFTQDAETGAVTLTPGSTGAFSWFFRESEIKVADVMNVGADGEPLGQYISEESNMFAAFEGLDPAVFTHFSVTANRLFDATQIRLGDATIALSLSEDGNELRLIFKDYDLPPFFDVEEAEPWYVTDDFDSDILGFASNFVKAE